MRSFLALLALSLASMTVAPVARAEEGQLMIAYMPYMSACVQDMVATVQQAGLDPRTERVGTFVQARCQCEYDRLPAEGVPVSSTQVKAGMAACESEFEGNYDQAVQRYATEVADRLKLMETQRQVAQP